MTQASFQHYNTDKVLYDIVANSDAFAGIVCRLSYSLKHQRHIDALKSLFHYAADNGLLSVETMQYFPSRVLGLVPEESLLSAVNYLFVVSPNYTSIMMEKLTEEPSVPGSVIDMIYAEAVERLLDCPNERDTWFVSKALTSHMLQRVIANLIQHPNLDALYLRKLFPTSGVYDQLLTLISAVVDNASLYKRTLFSDRVAFLRQCIVSFIQSVHFDKTDWHNIYEFLRQPLEYLMARGAALSPSHWINSISSYSIQSGIAVALAQSPQADRQGLSYLWRYSAARQGILSNPNTDRKLLLRTISRLATGSYYNVRYNYVKALQDNPAVTDVDLAPLLLLSNNDVVFRQCVQDAVMEKQALQCSS